MTLTQMEIVLGPLTAIPLGEGRAFNVGGEHIAVFRTRTGEVFAVQANCPHRGGPLADGLVGGTSVICPLHSSKFDLRTGQPLTTSQPAGNCALKTYPARLDNQERIVLTLGDPSLKSDTSTVI